MTNGNQHQASVEIPMSTNFNKINTANNNKKRNYEELYGNSIPSSSKKHSFEESFDGDILSSKKHNYEELFGDISDVLDTDIPGTVIDRQYDFIIFGNIREPLF